MVDEVALDGSQPDPVLRDGAVVRRSGHRTPAVHELLRRLESVGYEAAPRVVGTGYADDGREVISFIEGRMEHPEPMSR